jgi:putative sigma-54 modulation protein
MTILFTGRKAHLTDELKQFAETKLSKLERLLDGVFEAHVILQREKHRHVAEIVARSRRATLTATAVGGEFHDSLGMCIDRLLAQARKHSGRSQTRRRGRGAWTAAPRRRAEPAPSPEPTPEAAVAVVRMGRIAVKPMSIDEAALEIQKDRRPVIVFRNADSKEVAVIFRRPDGQFGLLEMEA